MIGRLVPFGSALAAAGSLHALGNAALLRSPRPDPPTVREPVSVLLPVRDEARRVGPCIDSLLAQRGVQSMEIVVLDDGSGDGTAEVVRRAGGDRVRLVRGAPLREGWLGKPHACQQLASTAAGRVLVFLDADTRLTPTAIASTVDIMGTTGLDLVSPYPRLLAGSAAERLVQPLLPWSWLTFVPLRLAERSHRPALAVAGGQLLAVRRDAYERAGGHAAIRHAVLDDLALARAIRRAGGRTGVVDGSRIATCRMYDGWAGLRDGYGKSLWAAFGSAPAAASAGGLLALAYLLPPAAALRGSRAGLAGYLAAVAGRVVTARRTGTRALPDALAHPASIAAFGWLTARSLLLHRRGALSWKGRPL